MILPRFADLSISRKLTLLFTLSAGLSLAAFAAVLWVYQYDAYRGQLRQEMATLGETLADSGSSALAFHDDKAAAEALDVLRAEPRVSSACLYRGDGLQAAAYSRAGHAGCPAQPGQDRLEFSSNALAVVQTARLRGEPIGKLWLRVDLADLFRQLRRLALICAAALGLSLLLAVTIASRLQRLISRPILDLAAIAGRVSARHDYSIRAAYESTDELGVLVARFNQMMEQIHQRDVALELAHTGLEERVRERTAELCDEIAMRRLAEQDLVSAKEAAEESDRAKSAFLATMSHELRTPLNAIVLYSDLLEEDALAQGNESALADLRCIKSSGRHLVTLITEILDFSKIEASRMELHPEPSSARSLITDVAATVQPLARKNHNEFEVDFAMDDFIVDVDPTRFRQSLLNLLSNACKFTEGGRVALTVERQMIEGERWVCFGVRDTGVGIAAEDMHKLFKPFTQVDSSATRKHGGTGLGLSISQRYCQMMGGSIMVSSERGKGSTFTIRLPESKTPLQDL